MRILLTHQFGRLEGLEVALEARGHLLQHIPLIRTEVLWETDLEPLKHSDCWVFTSRSAIEASEQRGVFTLPRPKIAVIGRASARVLEGLGIQATIIGVEETALGLAKALLELPQTTVFAWVRGTLSLPDLQHELVKQHRRVHSVVMYHTVSLELPAMQTDVLVVSSPSALQAISDQCASQVQLIALGSSTAAAIEARGWTAIVALEPTVAGIVAALEKVKGFL